MAFKDFFSKDGSTSGLLATTSDDGLMSAGDKVGFNKIGNLETRIDNLETRIGDLETRIGDLETMLEDALQKNLDYLKKTKIPYTSTGLVRVSDDLFANSVDDTYLITELGWYEVEVAGGGGGSVWATHGGSGGFIKKRFVIEEDAHLAKRVVGRGGILSSGTDGNGTDSKFILDILKMELISYKGFSGWNNYISGGNNITNEIGGGGSGGYIESSPIYTSHQAQDGWVKLYKLG